MDNTDKKLLNLIQQDFPCAPRPFEELGKKAQLSGEETIRRIRALKDEGVIRQIGAIFDTRRMGYASSLVAMKIAPERLDEAAAVINEHPGVSHNYGRNHDYNLWFTIALPPTVSLERTVNRLHELAGAQKTRLLPTLRLFKIGVQLDVTGESNPAEPLPSGAVWSWKTAPEAAVVTEKEIQAIRCLQEDLPVHPDAYAQLGAKWGLSEEQLFSYVESFKERQMIRRYAAVLHHRSAGFVVNGMGVWKVPVDRVEELGPVMGSFRGVSHCYQRPTYDDWPYTIFTMMHGRNGPEIKAMVAAIAEATGTAEYAVLYSVTEYKKIRVKYFSLELDSWAEKYAATPASKN
ncbi:MAG: Lrp/AsnC family transcriptional regulator [Candidatus Omnitrophica bacterium]|nr:Lrp/AsnC family transcriptional regulator [Candidatus Omnitrophota bacterium]